MDREAIVKLVINQLGSHKTRDEVARMLCERAGMSWPEAEQAVIAIERQYGQNITRRQSPLLLLFVALGIMGGLLTILFGVVVFLSGGLYAQLLVIRVWVPWLSSPAIVLTGLGMIAGSLWGGGKTLLDLVR
jgi:hypothetical protein